MRRLVLAMLFFIVTLGIFVPQTHAQRLAECDVCGFCRIPRTGEPNRPTPVQVPGNWQDCRRCMYPDVNNNPTGNVNPFEYKTLVVKDNPSDPYYNTQVTPKPGRYYTQLGCILTDFKDFTDRRAAGNVVTTLLQNIFTITGGLAFLYLIYGAYVVITAQGDPGRLQQGRSIIYSSIVGLIFVMLVTLILNLIGGGILRIPGFGG